MARISLPESLPSEAVCAKPQCGVDRLQRHHRAHEALWFGVWAQKRAREKKWKAFIKRYHEFRIEDTVLLCERHHAEIHSIYDRIIEQEKLRVGRVLHWFTWPEAEALMQKLKEACDEWIVRETPGMAPGELKHRRYWRAPTKPSGRR